MTRRMVWGAAALVAVVVWPVAAEVIISEIMYNPDSSESLPNDVEWVEVYNTGNTPVDISGWFLQDEDGATGGIVGTAILDPQEAAVIIPDDQTILDFQEAWGTGFDIFPVSNWGSGGLLGLSNSPSSTNEVLTLRDSDGNLVDEVNYDDEGDWPTDSPDGPSIYLLPGALDSVSNDSGLNWARSEVGVDGAYGNNQTGDFNGFDVGSPGVVIPEPAVLVLGGLGLMGLRRRA